MPHPQRRRSLIWFAKIVVSLSLLVVLFSKVDAAAIWVRARQASPIWLAVALTAYLAVLLVSAWRWGVLLGGCGVRVPLSRLVSSYLVATFFNNFLPSNIGGDVVRVADTARPAGSKTVATLIVLADRGIGLLALVAIAAIGASTAQRLPGTGLIGPSVLWLALAVGCGLLMTILWRPALVPRLLRPVGRIHPEWVGERLARLEGLLGRMRSVPGALATGFTGALAVQMAVVGFYFALGRGLAIPVTFWQLGLIVPATLLVQMLPLSINGFGLREATFGYYFAALGLPLEQALVLSLMGAALILLVSLLGAGTYIARGRPPVDLPA